MRQMRAGELRQHLARLRVETAARQQRLSNLEAKFAGEDVPEKHRHMQRVSLEINRLESLIEEGWRLYEQRRNG